MRRLKLLALAVALAVPLAACDEGQGGVEVVTGTISGTVTVDGTGLQGVTVSLSGTQTANTTTDAGGSFRFQDVEAGSYVVTIAGFPTDVSFPSTSKSAVISSNSLAATVNFSGMRIATSSIVGGVSAGGNQLSGVSVTLAGPQTGSTTTNASGQYAFTGLVAGSYTVSISGFDATKYIFTSTSKSANLGVGETEVVGFSGTEAQTATLTASVTVDGQAKSGVTVSIAGPADRSGTTGSSGQASFTSLPRGTYAVSITNPDPANISFDRTNASATISEIGGSASVSFAGSTIKTSSIAGRVFVDLNKNGTFDSGTDMPFNGLTVSLSGGATSSTTTGSQGTYSFGSLAAGSYTVSITNPDISAYTFDQTSQSFTLTSNQAATANFRAIERRDGAISGRVWFDNGDGVFTSVDEAAANFSISITGPEAKATTTSATGQFSFSGLLLGEYELSCDNCDASFAPTSPVTVTLTSSAPAATNRDFVSQKGQGAISGRLFIDGNENNTFDVNVDAEYPLAGVKISLEGPDVGTIVSVDTDANGQYSFTGLQPGSYNVTVDNADVDITDPVALGTDQTVQRSVAGGTSAVANFGFDITTWTVKVKVVFGNDNGNETPAAGVVVTAFGNRDLTNPLSAQATAADGFATLSISRAAESSIAGPRDNIIYTTPTPPAETVVNSEGTLEYHLDPNLFVQTVADADGNVLDHNLLWTKVIITGTYVERSGGGVPKANVTALGLLAQLGFGTRSDLADRAPVFFAGGAPANDTPNNNTRVEAPIPTFFPESTGQYSFKVSIPRAGGALPQVFSVTDISGSGEIKQTGNVGAFVSASVDGSQRTVTLPNLLITYPKPDVKGTIWHEANDQEGLQKTGADPDDFLKVDDIATVQVFVIWDQNGDGDITDAGDKSSCGTGATGTGAFTCPDIKATADPVHLMAQTTRVNTRFVPVGFTLPIVNVAADQSSITLDISDVVDDSKLTKTLTNEPFNFKFQRETVTVHVFNEIGAALDGNGVADGAEPGIQGVNIRITPTASLGTFTGEFPKTIATNAAGNAVFNAMFEGDYSVTVEGVSAAFTAGLSNLRVVQYGAGGTPIFTEAPLGLLVHSIDVQRVGPAPFVKQFDVEGQFKGGKIAGQVFDNNDDDATIDPNEFLAGQDVQLTEDTDRDGSFADETVASTSTTDGSAQYSFASLWEGFYQTKVVNPAGAFANPTSRKTFSIAETNTIGGTTQFAATVALEEVAAGTGVVERDMSAGGTADTDFEVAFGNTTITITVTDNAGTPAPLADVTVRLSTCVPPGGGAPATVEGAGNAGGFCSGETLVTTQKTNASGQIVFTNLLEGWWLVDPVETTASAGATAVHDFWVVRTHISGDSEARTAKINVP